MMKISLKDLPEDQIYLKFNDNYAEEFFGCFIKNYDADKIAKSLGLRSGIVVIHNYKKNKNSYPLFLVKRISKLLQDIDFKFSFEHLENHVIVLMSGKLGIGGRPSRPILNPKFPFELNVPTTRLIAHTIGDGDIHPYGRIRYSNSEQTLIDSFLNDLKELGDVNFTRGYDSGVNRINSPKIVKLVLDELGLKNRNYIFILNSNRENKKVFIQALFDDEGCVHIHGLKLTMNSIDKKLLDVIKKLLKEFNIISSVKYRGNYVTKNGKERNLWVLEITGFKNFRKFYDLIKLQHSKKIKDLEELIKSYKGKKIRPLRGETRQKILSLLKKKPMTVYELSEELKINWGTISSQIRKLALNEKIYAIDRVKKGNQKVILWSIKDEKIKYMRKFDHKELSKKLLKFLEKPIRSKQLAKFFNRTDNSILYHLRKLKRNKIIKSRQIGKSVFWVKVDYEFSDIEKLSKPQRKIVERLKNRERTSKEIAKIIGLNKHATEYHLYKLKRINLINSKGKYCKLWFTL